MKAVTMVVVLGLFAHTAASQGAWEPVASPVVTELRSVSFAGSDTGFAVAFSGQILRTLDGGITWDISGMSFSSAEAVATLTGGTAMVVGPIGIKRTSNGGATWEPVSQFPFAPYLAVDFRGITGWIAGGGGAVARSTDAGLTWQARNSGASVNLRSVCAIDESTAVAVGDGSTVIKTTDGGQSWNVQDLGGNLVFRDVDFWGEDLGFIVGGYSVIFRTTDGGASWSPVSSGTDNVLYSVTCTGGNDAVAVGYRGAITVTSDKGAAWQKQTSGKANHLMDVSFLSPAVGIAVGDSGVILRTTTAGKNSVRELPGLPTEYRLDQNYPNPFNPTTVIRYEIPYSATVRLTVYNLLGQEIAVLVSERQTPGIYEADFQASNLPSGTYLYRLTAGQYTLTKKMLLLK